MMAKRDPAVDTLRGMGMLLVIIGHVFVDEWTQYIYSFHMPLFFFLSGYCSARKEALDPPPRYLRRKCRTLLLPYAVFFFLSLALYNLRFSLAGGLYLKNAMTLPAVLSALVLSGGRLNTIPLYNFPLWFLPHLFVADAAFYGLRRLGRRLPAIRQRRLAALLLFGALAALTVPVQTVLPGRPVLHANIFPASLAFLLLGWLFGPIPRTRLWKKGAPWCCPLLLLAGYLIQAVNGGGNISNIHSVLYYAAALCSILGFYSLAARLESPVLAYIGRNAVMFIGLHLFVFAKLTAFPCPAFLTHEIVYNAMRLALCVILLMGICEGWRLARRLPGLVRGRARARLPQGPGYKR